MAKVKAEELTGAVHEGTSAATESAHQAPSPGYLGAGAGTSFSPNRGIEQTVSTLKDSMTQAAAGFEMTQARVKEGMEKAMKTAEEFVSFGQGNLEALMKSGQIWTAGMQDLSKQVAATAQSSFEETVTAFKAITAAKSVKDAFDAQANFARSALEKAISESGRLTDASFKLTEEALAPITARLSLAVETFAKPV